MKVKQYIITDEVKLTLVDAGYTIEIANEKYEGLINDFNDTIDMIESALEDTAIYAANYYDDDEYYDNVVLPTIHALEANLLKN